APRTNCPCRVRVHGPSFLPPMSAPYRHHVYFHRMGRCLGVILLFTASSYASDLFQKVSFASPGFFQKVYQFGLLSAWYFWEDPPGLFISRPAFERSEPV